MLQDVAIPEPEQCIPIRDINLYSIKDLLEYIPNTQPHRVVHAICCACVNEGQSVDVAKQWAHGDHIEIVNQLGESLHFRTAEHRYTLKTVRNMAQKCYPSIVSRVTDLYVRQCTDITLSIDPASLVYNVIRYNAQYVRPWVQYLDRYKRLDVRSTMETGKTLQCEATLLHLKPKSFLIIK